MKLVVMIPAYNEEETIEKVIAEIPKKINGIKKIEIIVIDDGSTDRTVEIAKKAGARILKNSKNMGLAYTFKKGISEAMRLGADIIVNTDGDFQYNQKQIPLLIEPILKGEADIVLGSRFNGNIEYMPFKKRLGNRIASWVVRRVSSLQISDAQTGFRAFSRDAALRMNIKSKFTYTQETIIQAAMHDLIVKEIPIDFRRRDGQSRLFSGIFDYAKKAGISLVLGYLNYKPLKVFVSIGLLFFAAGFVLGLKVLLHFFQTGLVSPYIPTAILTSILIIFGFQVIVIGLIASMIKNKREVQDEILYRIKKREFGS